MINCSIIRSGNEVKGQYAGRFISSARAALDEVTRITLVFWKQSHAASLASPTRGGCGQSPQKNAFTTEALILEISD